MEIETGNLGITHQDVAEINYHGLSLALARSYNTQNASAYSPFGYGWGHNYQVLLTFDPAEGVYTVSGGEGGTQEFALAEIQNGTMKSGAPYQTRLVKNAGESFDFLTKGGIKYHFNAALSRTSENYDQLTYLGNLSYIEDPHGNRVTLHYDNERRLARVMDGAGRALNFTYELSDVPISGFSADDLNATACSPASRPTARRSSCSEPFTNTIF